MSSDIKFEEQQIMISLELLRLLQWLSEQEEGALKQLIKKGIQDPHYPTSTPTSVTGTEEMREHVIQFFAMLETLLQEAVQEDSTTQQLRRIMLPAVDRVDSTQCDHETIARSLEKAAHAIETGNVSNSKEAFCRALIRNWTPPHTKESTH